MAPFDQNLRIARSIFTVVLAISLVTGCAQSPTRIPAAVGRTGEKNTSTLRDIVPGQADPDGNGRFTTSIEFESIAEYDEAQSKIHLIRRFPELYDYLNAVFGEQLIIQDPVFAAKYGFDGKSPGLAESQLLFLYTLFPEFRKMLAEFMSVDPQSAGAAAKYAEFRERSKAEVAKILAAASDTQRRLLQLNDPTARLLLKLKGSENSFEDQQIFVNHDIWVEPAGGGERELIPASNLKGEVLRFLDNYEKNGELMLNVYEFNLKEIAAKLIAKHREMGGKMVIGIYKETAELFEENREVLKMLREYEAETGAANFKISVVDSVGLNHQKIIALRGPQGQNGKVMFLSGNLTQSCIGPEGDFLGPNRPKESIPNSNAAVIVKSDLMAAATMHELRKTTIEGLRGSEYAIGGVTEYVGPMDPEKPGVRQIIQLAFSPSRGVINNWYLGPLVESARSRLLIAQFAMSSSRVMEGIERVLLASLESPADKPLDFRYFGDTGFSMREWAVSLALAGYMVDPETGKYIVNEDSELVKKLREKGMFEQFQARFKVNPKKFGDFQLQGIGTDGKAVKISVKMHHKLIVVDGRAIIASSYNISEGAEDNTEHLLLFNSGKIVRYAEGIVHSLSVDRGAISIAERAEARNRRTLRDEMSPSSETRREERAGEEALAKRKGPRLDTTMVTSVFDAEKGLFKFLTATVDSRQSFKSRVETALRDVKAASGRQGESFYYLVTRLRNVVLARGTYIDVPAAYAPADVYEGFALIRDFLKTQSNITIYLPPLENFKVMDSVLESQSKSDLASFRKFLKRLNDQPESVRHGPMRAFEYWAGSRETFEAAVRIALRESAELPHLRLVLGYVGGDEKTVAIVESGKVRLANETDRKKIEAWSVAWPLSVRRAMLNEEEWKKMAKNDPIFKWTAESMPSTLVCNRIFLGR